MLHPLFPLFYFLLIPVLLLFSGNTGNNECSQFSFHPIFNKILTTLRISDIISISIQEEEKCLPSALQMPGKNKEENVKTDTISPSILN